MSIRIISLLLVLTAVVVSAETVSPDSGKIETQVGLVDPFTLKQTPVTVELQSEPIVTTQDTDYHGTTSLFEWVKSDTGSKSMIVTNGTTGDWDWYRPIIIPARPNHRSPFTPDAEY